jgi:hypothetical protein
MFLRIIEIMIPVDFHRSILEPWPKIGSSPECHSVPFEANSTRSQSIQGQSSKTENQNE